MARAAAEAEQREKDLAAIRKAQEEAERARATFEARARATFEAGVKVVSQWFPGVEWEMYDDRSGVGCAAGYSMGAAVIVRDKDDSVRLCFDRRNVAEAGEPVYRLTVYAVERKPRLDSGTSFPYYSGAAVKSAADVGRFLEAYK